MTQLQQQHLPGISLPNHPIQVLTQDESHLLLEHLRTGYPRDYFMVKLALYTGLRNAETIALNVEDVAPYGEVARDLELPARAAKGHHKRTIALRDEIVTDLSDFLAWKRRSSESTAPDAPLFRSKHTPNRLSTRDFQRILKKAAQQALHRRVHPHMLRHTFGTRVLRGNDPKVVQQLLGHRNIQTTMIYDHPNTADHRRAVESIS